MTRIVAALVVWCVASIAFAHKPSDAYLTLERSGASLSGRFDIALRDLDNALGLDIDGDGDITWGEVRAMHGAIGAYALERLHVTSGDQPCELRVASHAIDTHTDGAYAVLTLTGACAQAAALTVDYRLFFDIDPQHRGLMRFVDGGREASIVLSADSGRRVLDEDQGSAAAQFLAYAREGVSHIWLGYDHILFLVSLLLPAVLRRGGGRWRPAQSFGASFTDVAKVVTAFTVAHSITLSIAVLGIVALPSRWVESAIAASVVVAALNNLHPVIERGRWIAAFAFGLIHGFGFAGALQDLGLPTGSLALALSGFNIGVEAGQLVIVAMFLPIAFAIRDTWIYRRVIFTAGSTAIAVIAAVWLVERTCDVQLVLARNLLP